MIKKIYSGMIILALLMILMVGCNKGKSTGGSSSPFIGGTAAIDFNFMEETPPSEVYDKGQQPFEVTLNLENKGEYDVPKEDINIKLSGFYPGDFNNPDTEKNPDEDLAKSYIDPDGDTEKGTITYVNFPGFNFAGTLPGNNEYTIRAEVCYKYGTVAQADLCVLEDLTSNEEEVCEVNEDKAIDSSSAPVQAESFKEEVAGTRKVKFSFDVVHRGNGLVSQVGSGCDSELIPKDKVWVEVNTGDLSGGLSCSGLEGGSATTGYAKIYGGKRKIICMQDVTGVEGNFEKKVEILFRYDYKEHKERNILVKHTTG